MPFQKYQTENLKCGHCKNTAPMEVQVRYTIASEEGLGSSPEDNYYPPEGGHTGYEICACPVCKGVTLRSYYWDDSWDPADVPYEILYPQIEKVQDGLPDAVRNAYEAAQRVKHVDANAYGVLLGRVLDITCDDRGAKGDTLDTKLKNLAEKGEIPVKLVAVAAGLRQMRNIGAHASLGELTKEDFPVLDDLTRAILGYVYSAPFLAEVAANRLAKLKRKKD